MSYIKSKLKMVAVGAAQFSIIQDLAFRINRAKTVFLAYHGVSSDDRTNLPWTHLSETAFCRQMRFLKKYFDCISIDEALARDGQKTKKPGAVVTFDDGYRNNLDNALPVLKQLEIPATIYITTGNMLNRELFWHDKIWLSAEKSAAAFVDLRQISANLSTYNLDRKDRKWRDGLTQLLEDVKKLDAVHRDEIVIEITRKFLEGSRTDLGSIRLENNDFIPLNKRDVRELAEQPLITIGAHTHCHNLLDRIPIAQAVKSILISKKTLEDLIGFKVNHFAYPNGNYSHALIRALREAGFKSSVAFQRGYMRYGDNPFSIPRYGVGSDLSFSVFKALVTGILDLKRMGRGFG